MVRLYDEHPAASNGHVNSIRINNCHPASDRRPRWRRVGRLRAVHARTCLAWCSGTCAVYALIVDNSAATFLRDWYRPCAVAPRLLQRRPRLASRRRHWLVPLQKVLHVAARLVLDLKLRDHPALRELHWLPIEQQIEYKLSPRAQGPCSDFMDMLRRLISCRII